MIHSVREIGPRSLDFSQLLMRHGEQFITARYKSVVARKRDERWGFEQPLLGALVFLQIIVSPAEHV
ncbi:MAG: hypothetical protein M5R41_07290 [Bacteroidia bacterium]|nr:hypothetical protein [Bacteroidia bacterium]